MRPIGSWAMTAFAALVSVAGKPAHHLGVDDSGADRVDADALGGVVERRRLRQADQAVLGGGIGRLAHDQAVPLVVGDLVCGLDRLLDAGVVEGNVQAAEALDRRGQRRLDLVAARHVARDSERMAAPPARSGERSRRHRRRPHRQPRRSRPRGQKPAVTRPMPLVAPVTNATLPANRIMAAGGP
jgi:hypothetical protein